MFEANGYFKNLSFCKSNLLTGFISDIVSDDKNDDSLKCVGLYKDNSSNIFIQFQKNDIFVLSNNFCLSFFYNKHIHIEFDLEESEKSKEENEDSKNDEKRFSISLIEVLE